MNTEIPQAYKIGNWVQFTHFNSRDLIKMEIKHLDFIYLLYLSTTYHREKSEVNMQK